MIYWIFLWVVIVIVIYILVDVLYISKLRIDNVASKAVLITGAGGGFGKGLAIRCLRSGMTVFAGCRRDISVKELKDECSLLGGKLYAFRMDVASTESVQKAADFLETTLNDSKQELFAVVNNAGVRGNQFFDDFLIEEDYRRVFEVNFFGAVRVCHAFAALIKKAKGRFIMCSSTSTLFSPPGYGPYASSKAALETYANVLRYELKPFSVEVITMIPGSFATPMNDSDALLKMIDEVWDRGTEKAKEEYGEDFIDRAKSSVAMLQRNVISGDLSWVIDDYFNAITAKCPKAIYRSGWDTILMFYPFSFLPVRAKVFLMRLLMSLSKVPLPAAVTKRHS